MSKATYYVHEISYKTVFHSHEEYNWENLIWKNLALILLKTVIFSSKLCLHRRRRRHRHFVTTTTAQLSSASRPPPVKEKQTDFEFSLAKQNLGRESDILELPQLSLINISLDQCIVHVFEFY